MRVIMANANTKPAVLPFNLVRIPPAQPREEKQHTPLGVHAYHVTATMAQTVKLTGLGFVDGWKSI
jgi:hypothetical protein